MKKELSLLLQFFLIVLLIGYGFFGLMLLQNTTTLSLWVEYKDFFINWILAFLVLASIRLIVISLTTNPSISTPDSKNKNHFIVKEIWLTFQYLVITLFSIIFSFLSPIVLKNNEGISINLVELWLGFKQIILSWLVGFLILSIIRIGIIYIKKIR
jgi:hypothetical protein